MRGRRIISWFAASAGALVYLFHALYLGLTGRASVVTTVLLFATLGALLAGILVIAGRWFGWARERRINGFLLVATVCISFCAADIYYLRYGLAYYPTLRFLGACW